MRIIDVKQTLIDYPDLFSVTSGFMYDTFRSVGWWLIKGSTWLLSQVESAMKLIVNNLTFYSSGAVGLDTGLEGVDHGGTSLYEVLTSKGGVVFALLGVGLVIVGFQLMFNRSRNKAQIPTNILLVMVLIFGLPTLLSSLTGITQKAVTAFSGTTSYSDSILVANITDLSYLDENDFDSKAVSAKNQLGSAGSKITEIVNPTETIDADDANNTELFESKIGYTNSGEAYVTDISGGGLMAKVFPEEYYRYQINWLTIFVTQFTMIIAMCFASVKIAKLVWNISYTGIFLLFISPLDLANGQRTKKIAMEIINMFVVIIAISFSFYLYIAASSWAAAVFSGLAYMLVEIGLALAVIGGPDIVQKILGIDAGIGGEMQKAASAMYMASTAAKGLSSMGRTAGKALSGAGMAGAGALGLAKGGVANALDEAKKRRGKANGRADSLHGEVIGGKGGRNSAAAELGNKDDNTMGKAGLSGKSPDKPDGTSDNINAAGNPGDDVQGAAQDLDGGNGASDGVNSDSGISDSGDGSTVAAEVDGGDDINANVQNGADSETIAGKAENDGSKDINGNGQTGSDSETLSGTDRSARQDGGGSEQIQDSTTTIGGAFKKWAGNTNAAKTGKRMQDAYRAGENTANQSWDSYRNQEKPIPTVRAEVVNNPHSATGQSGSTASADPIVVGQVNPSSSGNSARNESIAIERAPSAKEDRNTLPNKDIYSSNNRNGGKKK